MLSAHILEIIKTYRNHNPQEVALKLSGKNLPLQMIVQQIEGWQKAKDKLPSWHSIGYIVFPVRLSIEQCSSETTAKYKAEIVRKGNIIDLTGGFGVDGYYFSKHCKSVTYIEQNEVLYEIAKHNFNILNARNVVCINGDGLAFLRQSKNSFDTIFIDPARRSESGKKVFQLADCEPNVTDNLAFLFEKSNQILIKTSPLLDIDKTIADLRFVKEVHIISVDNECKEVLYLLENEWLEKEKVFTINIIKSRNQTFEFYRNDEKEAKTNYSNPLKYLYEPNSSILKSGTFKLIATKFNINKIAPNTHLYTSNELIVEFPGRAFEIKNRGSEKEIVSHLKEKKANVITRNYPLTANQLKNKLKIKDGGDDYVIGFQTCEGKNEIVLAERI